MIGKFSKLAAAAFLMALLAAPAWTQQQAPVIDGNLWLKSSAEVRSAFLAGASTMIPLETTYAKKKSTPPPVAGAMTAKAWDRLTLDDVSNRITRWYEANPDRRNLPVMAVVWIDMVEPGAAKKP